VRILQVIPYLSPKMGGPVQVVNNLSNYMSNLGHEIVVLTTDYFIEEYKEFNRNYQVVYLKNFFAGSNFFFSPSMVLWLLKSIRSYDVVHMHDYRTFQNAVSYWFAQFYNIPYVITPHGTIPVVSRFFHAKKVYDILFGRRIIRNAHHAFAVSKLEVDQLIEVGLRNDNISLTYNGFDMAEFSNLPPKGAFRSKFSIASDTKIILCLGRIHNVKGFDMVIKAFHRVSKEIAKAVLVIVGPDDGHLDDLHVLVNELDLKLNVIFTSVVLVLLAGAFRLIGLGAVESVIFMLIVAVVFEFPSISIAVIEKLYLPTKE